MLEWCSTGNTSISHSNRNGFQGCASHVLNAKFFALAPIPSILCLNLSRILVSARSALSTPDRKSVGTSPPVVSPSWPCRLDGSASEPSISTDGSVGRQYRGPEVCFSL